MSLRAPIVLAAIFLLSAASLRAEFTIDAFNASQDQWLKVTKSNPVYVPIFDGLAITSDLGSVVYRTLSLARVAGQPITVDIFSADNDGGLYFTQGTGQAITTLTWDNTADTLSNVACGLTQNLTAGGANAFSLNVMALDGGSVNAKITVFSKDGLGNVQSWTTPSQLLDHTGELLFPFTSFGSGVPLTNIGAIRLELNGTAPVNGGDIAIGSLTTVPEPSTIVLAAFGALAFVGMGRKWRKA
jgi:hypothetical protein